MLYFTKHEKNVLFALAVIFLCGSVLNVVFKSHPGVLARLDDENRFVYRTDVNKATLEELILVPYIGEKTAQRIVKHRAEFGPIMSLAELKLITGLHPDSLEKASTYLKIP